MLRSNSSQRLRKSLYTFPRLFKLFFAFLLVNAILIATIPSTQLSVFRNVGIIKSIDVGVYWDANCSTPVDEAEGINWGFLELGVEKILAVYVRNEGNMDWLLNITARGWDPAEAPNYITFRSEYGSGPIGAGEVEPVALALFVSPDIVSSGITSFAFNLFFQANE